MRVFPGEPSGERKALKPARLDLQRIRGFDRARCSPPTEALGSGPRRIDPGSLAKRTDETGAQPLSVFVLLERDLDHHVGAGALARR
jgi:hypothetical protein